MIIYAYVRVGTTHVFIIKIIFRLSNYGAPTLNLVVLLELVHLAVLAFLAVPAALLFVVMTLPVVVLLSSSQRHSIWSLPRLQSSSAILASAISASAISASAISYSDN